MSSLVAPAGSAATQLMPLSTREHSLAWSFLLLAFASWTHAGPPDAVRNSSSHSEPTATGQRVLANEARSSEAKRVPQWDIFEESFAPDQQLRNEFADVDLHLTFTRPDGTTVDFLGFYAGNGVWKFRFMPDQIGLWRYRATFSHGVAGPTGSFSCVPSTIPGMISLDESNPMWFGFSGGQHVLIRALHVGDRFFASRTNGETGEPWSAERRTALLDWAQQQGYNTLSIASHLLRRNERGRGRGWNSPDLWDSAAGRPNPSEFDRLEEVLNDLKQRRILIYPFAGFFGRSSDCPTHPAQQEVYLEYAIARLAPYWNVMFLVGGPEPRLRGRPYLEVEEIHRLGRRIRELDPFGHLLSVHNPTGDDEFKDAGWLSYGTLQGPKTLDRHRLQQGLLENHHPAKPLLAQETLWSGNVNHIRATGGGYSDDDLQKNAYVIIMSAATLVFADNDGNSSSGFSGSMDLKERRQQRHDIIRRVWDFFETVPFYRMKPRPDLITSADGANAFCLAEPGRHYLFYLDAPGKLSAVIEGGPYRAEWLNAQDTTERHSLGTMERIQEIKTPAGGDDWLLWLTANVASFENSPNP